VKFVMARDKDGSKFRFAPLQGTTFATLQGTTFATLQAAALISPAASARDGDRGGAAPPESMLVLTDRGELLARSNAVIHILRRLGGFWGFVGGVMAVFPRSIRDAVYNFVARVRYRIFGQRENLCPVMPAGLRARIDD
jgi:predicted DCC family thiol-disulfide oxidoreductase YuxK